MSTAADSNSIWVRVKPYNPKRGHKLKTYSVFGYRFQEGRGWYKINKTVVWGKGAQRKTIDVETYLKTIRNNPEDDQSPLVFDVCTEAEATAITANEKKKAEKAAEPSDPIVDLTSDDVREGTDRSARYGKDAYSAHEAEDGDLAPAAGAAPTRGRGRPPGSKNKPKATPAAE